MAEFSLLRIASIIGIGGSLLAVAVPAFVRNLSASKLSEALDGLAKISANAASAAGTHTQEESFPPSVELTPSAVPRGIRSRAPEGSWDHLTWRALRFAPEGETAFSFQFDSGLDPVTRTAKFTATARGDLDGDGQLSKLQVQGERSPGEPAKVLAGLLIEAELE